MYLQNISSIRLQTTLIKSFYSSLMSSLFWLSLPLSPISLFHSICFFTHKYYFGLNVIKIRPRLTWAILHIRGNPTQQKYSILTLFLFFSTTIYLQQILYNIFYNTCCKMEYFCNVTLIFIKILFILKHCCTMYYEKLCIFTIFICK